MTTTAVPSAFLLFLLGGCAVSTLEEPDKPSKDLIEDDPSDEPDDGQDEPDDDHGDDDDDDDGDDDGDDDDGGIDDIDIPSGDDVIEGSWTTTDEMMTQDACNMEDWVLDGIGDQIILDVVADGELELTDSRGTADCIYDEDGFDCDPRAFEDRTPETDFGLSAVIELQTDTWGSFDGTEYLVMETAIVADCAGSDCWLVEMATADFPCEMKTWKAAEAD